MSIVWSFARGLFSLVVPVFPETVPFGPLPVSDIALSLVVSIALCCAGGFWLTRSPLLVQLAARWSPELRDEAWEESRPPTRKEMEPMVDEADGRTHFRRHPKKRTSTELLFITVHNGLVALLATVAWIGGMPSLALHAFCLEVAYEVFDTVSLGMQRLEPETVIHHVVSPICILCSTQTHVDYRVLCHLCICIDLSGAILGYSKFLLRYAHVSPQRVYWYLMWMYGALRIVGPYIDTIIIVVTEVKTRGGFLGLSQFTTDGDKLIAKTDWTQLYFWAMAVLDTFNLYFFCVIRARARMPPQLCANLERMGCN